MLSPASQTRLLKNALIKQYKKLFDLEGVELVFTDESLKAVAHEALERKTGASRWGARGSKRTSTYTQAKLANALSTAVEADRALKTDNVNRVLNFERFLAEFISEVRE